MRKKTLVAIFESFRGYAYRSMCIGNKDNYCTLMISPNFACNAVYIVRKVEASVVEYIKRRDELRRGL